MYEFYNDDVFEHFHRNLSEKNGFYTKKQGFVLKTGF